MSAVFVYLFGGGRCFSKTRFESDALVAEFVKQSGSPAYGVSADDLALECAQLVDGVVKNMPQAITVPMKWAEVIERRNGLLAESDWTDTASAPTRLGAQLYGRWQTYRQALRDLTQQADPFKITWPTAPA